MSVWRITGFHFLSVASLCQPSSFLALHTNCKFWGNKVEPRYGDIGLYFTLCVVSGTLLNSLLLTLYYLVRTTLVYNDTKYSVPVLMLWPSLTVYEWKECLLCTKFRGSWEGSVLPKTKLVEHSGNVWQCYDYAFPLTKDKITDNIQFVPNLFLN